MHLFHLPVIVIDRPGFNFLADHDHADRECGPLDSGVVDAPLGEGTDNGDRAGVSITSTA